MTFSHDAGLVFPRLTEPRVLLLVSSRVERGVVRSFCTVFMYVLVCDLMGCFCYVIILTEPTHGKTPARFSAPVVIISVDGRRVNVATHDNNIICYIKFSCATQRRIFVCLNTFLSVSAAASIFVVSCVCVELFGVC